MPELASWVNLSYIASYKLYSYTCSCAQHHTVPCHHHVLKLMSIQPLCCFVSELSLSKQQATINFVMLWFLSDRNVCNQIIGGCAVAISIHLNYSLSIIHDEKYYTLYSKGNQLKD